LYSLPKFDELLSEIAKQETHERLEIDLEDIHYKRDMSDNDLCSTGGGGSN
jgi:hypothetical protein